MSETHIKQFRGNWVRAEIFELVEAETISVKEAWLLLVIDNFVVRGKHDCFASNSYLATKVQTKERQVVEMISKLRGMGLLVQTGFDGRKRYLSTSWSHLPTAGQTSEKSLGCLAENREADTRKTATIITKGNIQEELPPSIPPDGGKRELHPRWLRMAVRLATSIRKTRKLPDNTKEATWARPLEALHRTDGFPIPKIKEVLDWYRSKWEELDLNATTGHFIPVAMNGASFRRKFSAIEGAMARSSSTPISQGSAPASSVQLKPGSQSEADWEELRDALSSKGFNQVRHGPEFILAMKNYRNRLSRVAIELRDTELARQKKEQEENDGQFTTHGWGADRQGLRILEDIVPVFRYSYRHWIVNQVSEWTEWGQDMTPFSPGGKHFTRFLNNLLRELDLNYEWDKPIEEVLFPKGVS